MARLRPRAGRSRGRVGLTEQQFRALEERFMSGEEIMLPSQAANPAPSPAALHRNGDVASEEQDEEGTHFDLVFGTAPRTSL